jgi:hypothetical protein
VTTSETNTHKPGDGDPEGKETRSAKKMLCLSYHLLFAFFGGIVIFSSLVSSSPLPVDELKLIYIVMVATGNVGYTKSASGGGSG